MPAVLSSREEGELILVRVRVSARLLEDLLEVLATLPFPVNPELRHMGQQTVVEFPAFANSLRVVTEALTASGLGEASVDYVSMLDAIRSA